MFNMSHSGVLLDISKLLKVAPEWVDIIEQYGIKSFLDDCKNNDEIAYETLFSEYSTQYDVDNFNYTFNTKYKMKELIKYLNQFYLVLPHANYKNLDEIKDVLEQVHYDNPNIFQDLLKQPYTDIHNKLMQKYNSRLDINI